MTPTAVNQLICSVRHTNGILQILDQHKGNPAITLGEIHRQFEASFVISPTDAEFHFSNQDQLLTSLLAYLCLPSEKFHKHIPTTPLNELDPKWGLSDQPGHVTLYELIKFLRNAVSHGNVEISENLIFIFSDRDSGPKDKKIEVISMNDQSLFRFCETLHIWCLTVAKTLEKFDA